MVSFVPVISVLIRMLCLPVRGGDPFSHPSGSSVTRPARVTDQTAVPGLSSAPGARPPPGNREPENIQCPTGFIQWRQMVARAVLRQRVQPCADSRWGRITINSSGLSAAVVGFYRETSRCHSVRLARGSRPLRWFTAGLPKMLMPCLRQRRAADRRARRRA